MSGIFDYHAHLQEIADEDVRFLQKKDRSYGASWKKSGRSAWFMLKRMMDRLDAMMARPADPGMGFNLENVNDTIGAIRTKEHLPGTPQATAEMLRYLRDCYLSEDILAKMENEALDGSDGTVTAVLRDLRRYALLCEAEITQRIVDRESILQEQLKDYVEYVPVPGSEGRGGASGGCGGPSKESAAGPHGACGVAPVEDSNKHAERSGIYPPWLVDRKWRFDNGYGESSGRAGDFNVWWTQRTPDRWALRDCVEMPWEYQTAMYLAGYYIQMTNTKDGSVQKFLLDLKKCPPSLRSHHVKLPQECNGQEHRELTPEWARDLYVYDKVNEKWCLPAHLVAWNSW